MSELDVGQTFAGKYELVRLIGRGAMGEVWLARHETLGGEFAIKIVKPSDDIEDETAAGRFQLEAQISAKLSRKTRHIVACSDHGEEAGFAYIVMELLEGESLETRLKNGDPMTIEEATNVVAQMARGLQIAHNEGIFHRDLKPANVFLTRDEEGRILVKLLDFGIARSSKPFRTRSPFATAKDMVLGTPSYMSPEQARGLETLDYRCDIWALAVVAYEMLTKKIPWHGETVEDIFLSICTHQLTPLRNRRPDLPTSVDAIFDKAFSQQLDARFTKASEFASAFESISGAEPLPESNPRMIAAMPISMRTPAHEIEPHTNSELKAVSLPDTTTMTIPRQRSGNAMLWAGLVIALLILLGGAGFFVMKKDPTPQAAAQPPPTATQVAKKEEPPPAPVPTEEKKTDKPATVAVKSPPTPVVKPVEKPVEKPVPAPVVSEKPAVAPPPPPPTQPTAQPRKPTDKGEIF